MKNKLLTLPNVITLCNLACGCGAIVAALNGRMIPVFWLVAAAAAFDFADGMVARLTGQYSAVGRELDSLADVVSFGVAPSMALFTWWGGATGSLPAWMGFSVFALALFSALRLAKFNVDDTQHDEFAGLPTPACALAVVSTTAEWPDPVQIQILALVAAMSVMLVSRMRMFSLKFKTTAWRGNEIRYTFLATATVLVATLGIAGVAAAILLYVVVGAVRHGVTLQRSRKND
jgi:CDP-diacylglycerol--serine O-phosphatidyltransferase